MTRRLMKMASLLAATSLTACGNAALSSNGSPSPAVPAGWTTLDVKGVNSPVLLMHPSVWREIKAESVSQGPSANLEYLTNEPTVAQCHTSHTRETVTYTCEPPVNRLRPGGVLVTIGGVFLYSGNGSLTNTIVDGHPADVRTIAQPGPEPSVCPTGATGAEVMSVELQDAAPANPKSRWEFFAYACFASDVDEPNGALPAEINKMLRSTTFPTVVHG